MQKITAFFRLVRYRNLIFVIITQYFIRLALTSQFLEISALSSFQFLLFVFTTVLITAAGYIINDIYDVETDSINKKGRLIIGEIIKAKTAIIWYSVFNLVAIALGVYLAIIIGKPFYSLVFVYCIFFLWRYSKAMKKAFLIGNIHVAILTSLVLINTALFDIIPAIHFSDNISASAITCVKIVLVYALFSFLLTLTRELIKDIEDEQGDKFIKANTMAIVLGMRNAKKIVFPLIIIVVVGVGVVQYFQLANFNWQQETFPILYTTLIQIFFTLFSFKAILS
jgi:4-hydroxybenzoate polyprenyltransferase